MDPPGLERSAWHHLTSCHVELYYTGISALSNAAFETMRGKLQSKTSTKSHHVVGVIGSTSLLVAVLRGSFGS